MFSGFTLFPERASTMAGRVDALYFFLVALTIFFSLLIAGLIVYYAVKYRRRAPDSVGSSIHGGMLLEITWSVIPLLITMVIFVWGASVFFAMSRPPDETLNIYVVGKQWMWKFQHLDGQREINELHVPVGRPVKLIMTSEDVIHDVFVPAFRVKVGGASPGDEPAGLDVADARGALDCAGEDREEPAPPLLGRARRANPMPAQISATRTTPETIINAPCSSQKLGGISARGGRRGGISFGLELVKARREPGNNRRPNDNPIAKGKGRLKPNQ